jgi:hypothetical protein
MNRSFRSNLEAEGPMGLQLIQHVVEKHSEPRLQSCSFTMFFPTVLFERVFAHPFIERAIGSETRLFIA